MDDVFIKKYFFKNYFEYSFAIYLIEFYTWITK